MGDAYDDMDATTEPSPRERIRELERERGRLTEEVTVARNLLYGAKLLVHEVWQAVRRGEINARSRVGDAALDLRDQIDPGWNPTQLGTPAEERDRARSTGEDDPIWQMTSRTVRAERQAREAMAMVLLVMQRAGVDRMEFPERDVTRFLELPGLRAQAVQLQDPPRWVVEVVPVDLPGPSRRAQIGGHAHGLG